MIWEILCPEKIKNHLTPISLSGSSYLASKMLPVRSFFGGEVCIIWREWLCPYQKAESLLCGHFLPQKAPLKTSSEGENFIGKIFTELSLLIFSLN